MLIESEGVTFTTFPKPHRCERRYPPVRCQHWPADVQFCCCCLHRCNRHRIRPNRSLVDPNHCRCVNVATAMPRSLAELLSKLFAVRRLVFENLNKQTTNDQLNIEARCHHSIKTLFRAISQCGIHLHSTS